MVKPATLRPRTIEWVGGMAIVLVVAGVVLSRNGPQSVRADEGDLTSEHDRFSNFAHKEATSERDDVVSVTNPARIETTFAQQK